MRDPNLSRTSVVSLGKGGSASVLICFSHLRWDFVHQRPQHLLNNAAVTYQVYFFEEPLFESTGPLPRLDLQTHPSGVVTAVPVLLAGSSPGDCIEAQRGLLDDLLELHSGEELTFWYYTPMALEFTDHAASDFIVYDCMDELSAFRGAHPRLKFLERKLLERCDLVFTGGQSLYEAKRGKHSNVHSFPSSVDKRHFLRARGSPRPSDPKDQASIGWPRVGFFGVIDERTDLKMVERASALHPEWQFVFLGPVVKIDPVSLPRSPNIHWLGQKAYSELPDYLAHWSAGWMPFAMNESTRFISPTKTLEFLAAGVPVVSTPITDVVSPYGRMGLVTIARTPEEASENLSTVMAMDRSAWLTRVDAYLSGVSWDRTWSEMAALIRARTDGVVSVPVAASSSPGETTRV